MEKKQLPLIESDASVRVWVNKGLGKVVTDMIGTGDNLLPEDYEAGYGAYSLQSVYNIEDLPDGSFNVSDLEDVGDGGIDYSGESVSADNSSMVLMEDTDDYDKPEHFDAVMEELGLGKTGWKQVIGPAMEAVKPGKKFRITFRSEIYIEAASKEEAESKFGSMELYSQGGRQNGAAWVETSSIEEA